MLTSLALCFLTQQPGPQWTWVLGRLVDPVAQAEYEALSTRMFEYYQEHEIFPGTRTSESSLAQAPSAPVVFLGPIQAFEHPEWLAPQIQIEGNQLSVAGRKFLEPRLGLFVRNEPGDRICYLGSSLEGLQDIFTIPTGRSAASVMLDGELALEGEYRSGELEWKSVPFRPPYPTPRDLARYQPLADAISVEPLYSDPAERRLRPAFRQRLGQLLEGKRVLFVGENHWNIGVQEVFQDILSTLLESTPVSTLFLELNFSFSAHYDHFVTLDDAAAVEFQERELGRLVHAPSTMQLLELVRVWNRDHPQRTVRVACYDLEFDPADTWEHVVRAYMATCQPQFEVPSALAFRLKPKVAIEQVRAALDPNARAAPHEFLTGEFCAQVLTNLLRTLEREPAFAGRQETLLKNLLEIYGERLEVGLSVFKVGSYHADRVAPSNSEAWREAAYLDQQHAPTKGAVASLRIAAVGYGFEQVDQLDFSKCMRTATLYTEFVQAYRRALERGRAEKGAYYRFENGPLPVLDALMAFAATGQGDDVRALRLVDFDQDRLADYDLGHADTYDEVLYVLRSQLEPPRAR